MIDRAPDGDIPNPVGSQNHVFSVNDTEYHLSEYTIHHSKAIMKRMNRKGTQTQILKVTFSRILTKEGKNTLAIMNAIGVYNESQLLNQQLSDDGNCRKRTEPCIKSCRKRT